MHDSIAMNASAERKPAESSAKELKQIVRVATLEHYRYKHFCPPVTALHCCVILLRQMRKQGECRATSQQSHRNMLRIIMNSADIFQGIGKNWKFKAVEKAIELLAGRTKIGIDDVWEKGFIQNLVHNVVFMIRHLCPKRYNQYLQELSINQSR